ncbi:MAG: VWA domain-containing protein, partial [Planctomycetota bacterium]
MSFLPQFLNLQAAAWAAAISVPLLVLLYFLKLRRTPQSVASTLLWKRAVQDLQVNSPFQRLRRNILLLLQLLVLAALLFALARPVSEGAAIAGDKNVILIDRSASMTAEDADGQSRLEAAKEQAKDLIATLDGGATAMVIAFDDQARIVQPFTSDAGLLRAAIDDITPTDRPTRLADAYKQANANMAFDIAALRPDEASLADVFLFSDGRVPASDIAELSLRGNLQYRRLGGTDAENLAVVAASAKRNYENPASVQVFARFENFGPQQAEAQARVFVAPIPTDPTSDEPLEFRPVGSPLNLTLPPARWTDETWRIYAESNNIDVPANPLAITRR